MQTILFAVFLLAGLETTTLPPSLDQTASMQSPMQTSLQAPTDSRLTRSARAALDRLDQMSDEEQLRMYFGASRSARGGGSERVYSLRRFLADPALAGTFETIEAHWLQSAMPVVADTPPGTMLRRLIEVKIMVARNLYLRAETATRAAVLQELDSLKRARSRYSNLPLFAGRTVVFAASEDRLDDGRPQFGRLPARVAIEREASRFFFFRGDQDPGLDLENLIRREREVTFVFEGHGRAKALKLDGGMSVRRLARALAARPAGSPPAIVIIDACRAHDFARRLLDALDDSATLPIVVVPDEYGQSLLKEVFQAGFLRGDLMAPDGSSASVGSALQAHSLRLSVYVPGTNHRPMQIG